MDEQGLVDLVARFGDILRAGVLAVAGYGILDENVDSNKPSPVESWSLSRLSRSTKSLALDISASQAQPGHLPPHALPVSRSRDQGKVNALESQPLSPA